MKNFILLSLVMLFGIFVGASNINSALSPDLTTRIEVRDIPGENLMQEIERNMVLNQNFSLKKIYHKVYDVKARRIASVSTCYVDDG